jgi:hypothetical protein
MDQQQQQQQQQQAMEASVHVSDYYDPVAYSQLLCSPEGAMLIANCVEDIVVKLKLRKIPRGTFFVTVYNHVHRMALEQIALNNIINAARLIESEEHRNIWLENETKKFHEQGGAFGVEGDVNKHLNPIIFGYLGDTSKAGHVESIEYALDNVIKECRAANSHLENGAMDFHCAALYQYNVIGLDWRKLQSTQSATGTEIAQLRAYTILQHYIHHTHNGNRQRILQRTKNIIEQKQAMAVQLLEAQYQERLQLQLQQEQQQQQDGGGGDSGGDIEMGLAATPTATAPPPTPLLPPPVKINISPLSDDSVNHQRYYAEYNDAASAAAAAEASVQVINDGGVLVKQDYGNSAIVMTDGDDNSQSSSSAAAAVAPVEGAEIGHEEIFSIASTEQREKRMRTARNARRTANHTFANDKMARTAQEFADGRVAVSQPTAIYESNASNLSFMVMAYIPSYTPNTVTPHPLQQPCSVEVDDSTFKDVYAYTEAGLMWIFYASSRQEDCARVATELRKTQLLAPFRFTILPVANNMILPYSPTLNSDFVDASNIHKHPMNERTPTK